MNWSIITQKNAGISQFTKNVAPYSIVGGNPLKFIRKRFSEGVIEEWLALQWWNLDMKIINENLPFIINGDIEMLKSKVNY